LKDDGLVVGPGAIAGHRAFAEAPEYGLAVPGDVVVRPEVERRFHRLTVALPKERLDVLLEVTGSSVADK
jgi:hypothetical protein